MGKYIVIILPVCFWLVSTCIIPSTGMAMEMDTDRPGLDYRSFDMPWDDPDICREACSRDAKCQAWTYVKPGIQGPYSRCWLKHAVPAARRNSCCTSGIKGGQSPDITAPAVVPKNCEALRNTYFKQCDEIKGYYANLNCKTHGYSGCALDVVSCFTPFLPSHIFTDEACGRPGFIPCATKIYDRHLECLKNCNENSIAGSLPQGLQRCLDSCKVQIDTELKRCP